jgi:hypothetical protein
MFAGKRAIFAGKFPARAGNNPVDAVRHRLNCDFY